MQLNSPCLTYVLFEWDLVSMIKKSKLLTYVVTTALKAVKVWRFSYDSSVVWNFYMHKFYLNITRSSEISFKFRSHLQKLGATIYMYIICRKFRSYNENFGHYDDLILWDLFRTRYNRKHFLYFTLLWYYIVW